MLREPRGLDSLSTSHSWDRSGARSSIITALPFASISSRNGRLGEGKPRIPHLSPERRRQAVDGIRRKYGLSERQACRIVGQHRGTQRYATIVRFDEDALMRAIISLASQYGRYGYRRITSLLVDAGWQVGCDRVQRIWRREGLKVPRNRSRGVGSGSTTDPASV